MNSQSGYTGINYDWFYYIVLLINVIVIFFPIILVIIFIVKEKKRTIFSFLDFYLYLGTIFHCACYFVPPFKFDGFGEDKIPAETGRKIQGVLAMSTVILALTILSCISYVTYTNFTSPTFFLNNKTLFIILIHSFIFGIPLIFMIVMFASNTEIEVGISRYCWGKDTSEIVFYCLVFILFAIAFFFILKLKRSVGTFMTDCGNDTSYDAQVKTVKHYYVMLIFSPLVLVIEIVRLIVGTVTGKEMDETKSALYGALVVTGDIVEQIMFPIFIFVFGFTETRFAYFKELICCQNNTNILTNIEEKNKITLIEKKEEDDDDDDDDEVVEHEEED